MSDYLDVSKCTPGPWSSHGPYQDGDYLDGGYILSAYTSEPDYSVGHDGTEPLFGPRCGFSETDAALIAEAGTVAHETGKGPRQLADELREAQAIVEKLPKTADGVVVVPCRDTVWHVDRDPYWGLQESSPDAYVCVDGEWWVSWAAGDAEPVKVSDCYATREAAEAAQQADGGGE